MPASNPEINLCKTMMTAHALGYPTPVLIGYNETYDHAGKAITHTDLRERH